MAKENGFWLGTAFAVIATLISFILGKFLSGIAGVTNLYSSYTLQSGISPTIGNAISGIFTSIGFNFTSFLMLWFSAVILAYIGIWAVDALNIKGEGFKRYFWILMIPTAIFYIIFVGFVLKIGVMGAIMAVVYAAIVALLTGLVYPALSKFKIKS